MGTFYLMEKTKKGPRRSSSWIMVQSATPESAVARYVKDRNASVRAYYSKIDPEFMKTKLLTKSDIAVRKTPPQTGDIVTYEREKDDYWMHYTGAYVPRRAHSPQTQKKLPKRKSDKQLALLIKESQRVRWPVAYSNDLYKHDKTTLARLKPDNFIWVLRERGTHLYVLDNHGSPLALRTYKGYAESLRYHAKYEKCKYYFVQGTRKITPIPPKKALELVEDAYFLNGGHPPC